METKNVNAQLKLLIEDPNITNKDLIESPLIAERFEFLYKAVNGIADDKVAHAYYETEKFYFLKRISESRDLQVSTKMSLFGVFLDVAVSGLSFDPSMNHVYVYARNVNVGTNEVAVWEKRANMDISPYGELLLRQQQGQIKYADNPVLVYEGDQFVFGTKSGKTVLDHLATIPRVSDNIIAGYIKLTRHDDSYDFKVMATEDVLKLKEMSKSPNSLAWKGGFPGMVMAKVLKHAFKNFPKLRVGAFSKLQSDTVEQPLRIDYGFEIPNEEMKDPSFNQQTIEQSTGQQFTPQPNFNSNPQIANQHQGQQIQQPPTELDF